MTKAEWDIIYDRLNNAYEGVETYAKKLNIKVGEHSIPIKTTIARHDDYVMHEKLLSVYNSLTELSNALNSVVR